MDHFVEFMGEFTHVANILRHGNHQIFIQELEDQLDHLEVLLERAPPPPKAPSKTTLAPQDFPEDTLPLSEPHSEEASQGSDTQLAQVPEGKVESQEAGDSATDTEPALPQDEPDMRLPQLQLTRNVSIELSRAPRTGKQEEKRDDVSGIGRAMANKSHRVSRSYSEPVRPSSEENGPENSTKAVESIGILRGHIARAKAFYEREEQPGPNLAIGELVHALSTSKDLKQELHLALLEKRANNRAELRDFPIICGEEAFNFGLKRIERIRAQFSRHTEVLSLEEEELSVSVPLSTLLTMGKFPVLNFNWEHELSPKNFLQFPHLSIGAPAQIPAEQSDVVLEEGSANDREEDSEGFSEDEHDSEGSPSSFSETSPSIPGQGRKLEGRIAFQID
jgi:hypothetical protein